MENEKKQKWLEERKHYITGTDIGAIMGICPASWNVNALTVYLDKKGLGEPFVETEAMRWGLKLEAVILKDYAERMNCRLVNVDGYDLKTNDEFPRLACSLDGWNMDLNIPVDAKNICYLDSSKWGESGTDMFPDYYKAQLQVQMMVMNAPMAHLAVLFSGQKFRVYQMEYNQELADAIVRTAEDFWNRYMAEGSEEQPMPTADATYTDTIKKLFAKGTKDKKVEATDEIKKVARALVSVKARKKELECKEGELSNRIKLFMSDATICEGVCTWKNNKDSVKTDYDKIGKYLLESKCTEEERDAIIKNYTFTETGARVLRMAI